MAAPVVSCIIVCWRKPDALRPMVKALNDDRLEVIVVNPEIDPEVARVASACTHVPLEGDPGFATAVNVGVRHASCEYTVFMNDDVDVSVDTVLALRDAVASGRADVAVPAVVDADGHIEPIIRALPTPRALVREWLLLPDHPRWGLERRLRVEKWRRPQRPEQVEAAGPPVTAVRTQLLRDVAQPEDYFLYWDEIEWFWHLREQGRTVMYFPQLTVGHGGGRLDVSTLKSRLITQNAVKCVRKTQGRAAARRAFAVILAYNLRLTVIAALRVVFRRVRSANELRARLAGLRATPASWREITGERARPPGP